jgi:hypothetical protein
MSTPNQLSFLPEDYLATKAQARTNAICAFLFLVVILALAGVFTMTEQPLRTAKKLNSEIGKQYSEAARPIEQFRQMQEKQRQVTTQAELTSALLEKVPRSYLLAEITNDLTQGTSLLEVSLETRPHVGPSNPNAGKTQYELKKMQMEAARGGATAGTSVDLKSYDVNIKVVGMADNDVLVAQFMGKLKKSKLLRDVNLVVSEEFERSKEKVRKFQVEMLVNPDADIERMDKNNPKTASLGASEMR